MRNMGYDQFGLAPSKELEVSLSMSQWELAIRGKREKKGISELCTYYVPAYLVYEKCQAGD